MVDDILMEIPDENLPELQNLLKKEWPHALHAYYYLDNYIEWKKKNVTNIRFFAPENKWDDGTFIAIENRHLFSIFVFTLEKTQERLGRGLRETKRIPWDSPKFQLVFLTVHNEFHPLISSIIEEKKLSIIFDDPFDLWWIKKEDALKYEISIPDDVYINPLVEEDVKVIDPVWPHKDAWSESYLKELIKLNGGFGLYKKEDNTLCSWIMRNNYGGLAILQTIEECKRKGYASIMAKYFSKYWAEKGLDIFCFIIGKNVNSQQLFQKLGYKKQHRITWFFTTTK